MDSYQARSHTHGKPKKLPGALTALDNYFKNVRERQRKAIVDNRPADPLGPLTQLGKGSRAFFDTLSAFTGAKDIAQNPTSPLSYLGLLGPLSMVRSQIGKGALKFLPTNPLGNKSVAADALSELGKYIKVGAKAGAKAGAVVIPTGAVLNPSQAEGNAFKELALRLAGLINTKTETLLRPVGQGIGKAMPPKTAQDLKKLMKSPETYNLTSKQMENLNNLFNTGKYSPDILKLASQLAKETSGN